MIPRFIDIETITFFHFTHQLSIFRNMNAGLYLFCQKREGLGDIHELVGGETYSLPRAVTLTLFYSSIQIEFIDTFLW